MEQDQALSSFAFTAPLWHWRGPAPHYFLRVPAEVATDLKALSGLVTYGWGMIPVTVTLGQADLGQWEYDTSLFPKDGGYLVPVRGDVRGAAGYQEGDAVACAVVIRAGKARRGLYVVAPAKTCVPSYTSSKVNTTSTQGNCKAPVPSQ